MRGASVGKEAPRPQDRPPDLIPDLETTPHDHRPGDKTDFTKNNHVISLTNPEINDLYAEFNRDPGFGHDCAQTTRHPDFEHHYAQTAQHLDFRHDHAQTARHPNFEHDLGPSSIRSARRYAPTAHQLEHDWGPTNVLVNTIVMNDSPTSPVNPRTGAHPM